MLILILIFTYPSYWDGAEKKIVQYINEVMILDEYIYNNQFFN